MNLLELLRAPAVGAPRSLSDQLALIRKLWKPLLGDSLERFLLIAGEILHEEELAIWMQFNPAAAQAATQLRPQPGAAARAAHSNGPRLSATPMFRSSAIRRTSTRSSSPDTAWMPTYGADRQEHLCVAGAVEQAVWPPDRAPG